MEIEDQTLINMHRHAKGLLQLLESEMRDRGLLACPVCQRKHKPMELCGMIRVKILTSQ